MHRFHQKKDSSALHLVVVDVERKIDFADGMKNIEMMNRSLLEDVQDLLMMMIDNFCDFQL